MSLNFLDNNCREAERTDQLFGLCDDQDGKKAYSNTNDPTKWIATVKNEKAVPLVFTAIDNCMIQNHEFSGRGRCDGMLSSKDHLYFVELKNAARGKITGAIDQLESTIKFFRENHDINAFRHKKAFVCNKHRHFQEIDNEFNQAFFRKHSVRIDIQAEIIIV